MVLQRGFRGLPGLNMTGFAFIIFVLVVALMAGFRSQKPGQLPGLGMFVVFTLAAGAFLFV